MSSGSGYAGRHRDPVPPVAAAPATAQSHHLVWLFGGAVVVVLLLVSVLVYPSLTSNQTPQTGARPATSSTSERGLQYLGAPEGGGTGTEWPTGTSANPTATTSTADPTSATVASEPGTTSAVGSTSSSARSPSTSTQPSTSGTPLVASTSGSSTPTTTTDNPRAVAQALFPSFGFPDNEFGCLNATWNRLGLWSTAAAVRPGLIYVQSRYGTPCAAWDHVRKTGNY